MPAETNASGPDTVTPPPLDMALLGASADAPISGAPDEALVLVEALSVAWATFTLYEDPRGLEAFTRATQTLAEAPLYPWRVEVGPEGFSSRGEPVASRREAARRLARQIFTHGSAAIEIIQPPTPDDVLGLFRVLSEEPDGEDATERLFAAGVTTIALLHRELLRREMEEEEASAEVADVTGWCTGYDGEAEPFVHSLLAEMPDDPTGLAVRFLDEYERVFGLISQDDHWGMEEVVHTFVDALSFLPRDHQAAVLDRLLARQEQPGCLVFLDQMGGEELGDLARHLGPEAHPLLVEYARIAAEQGERRHGELLRLLAVAERAKPVGQTVVDQVGAALRSGSGTPADISRSAMDRLSTSIPTLEDHTETGIRVLRGLMEINKDGKGLESVAAVWANKAAEAIRADDLAAADSWLTAVGGLGFGPAEQNVLLRALGQEVDPPLVDRVVSLMSDSRGSSQRSALLRAAPLFLVDGLIAQLADTEETGRRKRLLEGLIALAPHRPDALVPHVDDQRWYVVRNVVLALGRSNRPDLADSISRVAHHPDHRVRREVLRSLHRLQAGLGAAELLAWLDDPHGEVREEAAGLISRSEKAGLDQALDDRLAAATSRERKLAIVSALGFRSSPGARQTLTRLATKRFAFGAETRALRRAARAALARPNEEDA